MAAQIQPPEAPIASPLTTADAAIETAAAAIPQVAATAPIAPSITTAHAYAGNPGPPPKRQRRPSVRLGEIGGDQSTLESHHPRRPTRHPWRLPRDSSAASKAVKARSLTYLVNGGADSLDNNQELEERNNNNAYMDHGSAEFNGIRKGKAKRGTATTKRVRSNWIPRPDDGAEGDNNSKDDGHEGYRDFDPDSDSAIHSLDNVQWRGQRRLTGSHRVLETRENDAVEFDNFPPESDSRDRQWGNSEGVRSWLIELGLSRYAPMFEIHEVDDQVLPMLTLEDLKDMGINAVGSRRKLYTAIQKLLKELP